MAEQDRASVCVGDGREVGALGERGFLAGIAGALRHRGTRMQRVLCFVMMALMTCAQLPGGGYCCQAAMFAVLLRLGYLAVPAFAGMAAGFVLCYGLGDMAGCWQLPCGVLLWLSSCLWVRRASRLPMAAAVFFVILGGGVVGGVHAPLEAIVLFLTACAGAGLSILYDGAALSICHRDELDGETRPLCLMAVCASLLAGLLGLPHGDVLAMSLAAYLTIEHAFVGGGAQAVLCAGVLGGVLSVGLRCANPAAMLLCGGFLAAELRGSGRLLASFLMTVGMMAAAALLGGEAQDVRLLVFALPGLAPFLILPPARRAFVTGMIERAVKEEMTQSEAVAVRCASMIHAWAGLYENTARMMEGLCAVQEENPQTAQCIRLLRKTSAAAHQVCERTLGEIRPDDAAYKRLRYALVREGLEEVRVAYALRMGEKMEVLLLKPEHVAPVSLQPLVSRACGVIMQACVRDGLLTTQALYEQAAQMDLEIGAACRSRSGEDVTGDCYVSRALPGGRHVLALSDGMGCGAPALEESHAALSLMVEALRAGYTRAQALDVVNALMLMCTGREMYATMDLCVCDLHSGEAAFEKLGACASYVVREGEVRSIGGGALPVGVLPDVESQSLRMTLRPDDVVILMTDGVADAYPGGEEALRGAIAKLAWLHPRAVGEKLIAQAIGEGAARDDMTVLCARVRKRMIE
ncbi:MAG: SpoIIE family protein phosphatase [Clostridia bacterium]|nr:SpoIIE family protein phosphatase [Clostridia bacterium]